MDSHCSCLPERSFGSALDAACAASSARVDSPFEIFCPICVSSKSAYLRGANQASTSRAAGCARGASRVRARLSLAAPLLGVGVEAAVGDELGRGAQPARVAVHAVNVADEEVLRVGRLTAHLEQRTGIVLSACMCFPGCGVCAMLCCAMLCNAITLASKLSPPGARPPCSITRFITYVESAGSVGNMSVSHLPGGGKGAHVRRRELGWAQARVRVPARAGTRCG